MKKSIRVWITVMLTVIFGVANASTTNWFGYARTCFNGENWQNKIITFTSQNPNEVQAVSETLPELWAATYIDGYVWFVTQTRSLCKAPFDQETQTIGPYETIVPELELYNLYIDMAYNPVDGMMYYLCQDSQYTSYLKRSNLDSPSEVETVGSFSIKLWTLAINSQGQAYGVAYEGGNLYEIDLTNANTTLVGPTGKEVQYTQSMAFDLDTDELLWAQFATSNDHGLYQVNTETGAATSLGEIGLGTQLTGLFMVPQATESEVIHAIYVEGFTAPAWGEHPDFDLELHSDAHYIVNEVDWFYRYETVHWGGGSLHDYDYYDREDVYYQMDIIFVPEEGFVFDEDLTVYYNGDSSPFNPYNSYVMWGGKYLAATIYFQITDPTGITEQTAGSLDVWPNPASNILHLDVMDGITINVFDMTGRMVMQENYEGKLDVSHLVPGIYTIKAEERKVRFVKE